MGASPYPTNFNRSFFMKITTLRTVFILALHTSASAVEIPVGTVSTEQSFALSQGDSFVGQSLSDYDGSILVVMLMTPWCPICNSITAAVGNGILDHFNDPSRGALEGQNDNGVPIRSVVLSTEQLGYDAIMVSIQANNGYEGWGLDAATDRSNPRVLLGYYRGGFIDSSSLYDWGNDRRRVVVLNLVDDSSGHQYREILLNMNSFSSGDYGSAQAAINAVAPAPEALSFEQWRDNQEFPPGMDILTADPDEDGSINAFEFYFGTNPKDASSKDLGLSIIEESGQNYLVYRRARGIGGYSLEHQHSTNLSDWDTLDASNIESTELEEVDMQRLLLPTGYTSSFYRLELTIP